MRKFLISIEIVIAYMPIFLMWLAGVFMSLPFAITGIVVGVTTAYLAILLIILGAIGIWGVVHLVRKLMTPSLSYSIRKYRNHLILGCFPSFFIGSVFLIDVVPVGGALALYSVLPVIVTIHLYYVVKKAE
jgi:hypothetical protein